MTDKIAKHILAHAFVRAFYYASGQYELCPTELDVSNCKARTGKTPCIVDCCECLIGWADRMAELVAERETRLEKREDYETTESFPRLLSMKRKSEILKLNIGGNNTVYLGKGEYDNGDLGEIFIDLHKEGSTMRSIMNCFAIAVSLGLQYGVPLKTYVDFFKCVKFEPNGMVRGHDNIKRASSIVSLIFRVLGIDYLDPDGFRDEEE